VQAVQKIVEYRKEIFVFLIIGYSLKNTNIRKQAFKSCSKIKSYIIRKLKKDKDNHTINTGLFKIKIPKKIMNKENAESIAKFLWENCKSKDQSDQSDHFHEISLFDK